MKETICINSERVKENITKNIARQAVAERSREFHTMLPGCPQCTSQSGRFHDFTSSTKVPKRDLTVPAVAKIFELRISTQEKHED